MHHHLQLTYTERTHMLKKRIHNFCWFMIIILLGLLSRKITFLPLCTGDILWGIMIFFLISFLFLEKSICKIASISLATCYIVEFSQLIQIPWLNQVRSTKLGHLVLGQGFLWSDLVAYTLGIASVWYIITLKTRTCK